MFSRNKTVLRFRLVNLSADVRREIKKLILDNKGELVDIEDRSVPNFTMPSKYKPGMTMYDIAFIKDCVRFSEIRDLHQYKLGPQKEYSGCIMSIFLYETPSCMHRPVDNPSQQIDICSTCESRKTSKMLDVDNAKGLSQKLYGTLQVIPSEKLRKRNTLNILDVSERPSPTQTSTAKRSYNKDPETIFGGEADRSPKHCKIVPSTSYAVSSDDSDFEDINTIMNDRLRCKRNDDDKKASTASTSEVETSGDDSEAKPSIKVKYKNKRASDRSTSELHITCVENRRPFQGNVNIIEWIIRMKNKAQNMERPRTRNFANWEKWQMLIFLIENDWIERAKGYDVWQHMIRRKDWNHRTKMSLNNHFLKSILPSIETFQLPKEIEIRFVRLRNNK